MLPSITAFSACCRTVKMAFGKGALDIQIAIKRCLISSSTALEARPSLQDFTADHGVGALPGLKPFAVFGRPFGTSGRQCGARPNPAAGWRVSRKSHKGLCSYRDAAAIVGAESLRRFARGDDPVGGRRRIPSAKDAAATTSPAVTRSRPRFGGAGVPACARPGGNMLPRYWGPRTTGQALPRYRGPGGCRETVRQALPR